MRKIEVFELENGELIKDQDEAIKRTNRLLIERKLIKVVETVFYNGINMQDIVETLLDNINLFRDALKEEIVEIEEVGEIIEIK